MGSWNSREVSEPSAPPLGMKTFRTQTINQRSLHKLPCDPKRVSRYVLRPKHGSGRVQPSYFYVIRTPHGSSRKGQSLPEFQVTFSIFTTAKLFPPVIVTAGSQQRSHICASLITRNMPNAFLKDKIHQAGIKHFCLRGRP